MLRSPALREGALTSTGLRLRISLRFREFKAPPSARPIAPRWRLLLSRRRLAARAAYDRGLNDSVRPIEAAFEAADIEVLYGDIERADRILYALEASIDPADEVGEQATLTLITMDLRRSDLASARKRVSTLSFGRSATGPAIEARRLVMAAQLHDAEGSVGAPDELLRASRAASMQRAHLWARYTDSLLALRLKDRVLIPAWLSEEPAYLSMTAEAACAVLDRLDDDGFNLVAGEAARRPDRWRSALRSGIERGAPASQIRCAEILDQIGTLTDVPTLRSLARRLRLGRSGLGRNLARRLAARVWVEDLGRVRVDIGARQVEGGQMRRKVLALLCLLLSKPRMAASREEIIDALWPDTDPAAALNSLNQTVYFLRRVFEPDFDEDLSPGYVEQNSDTLWLDPELVSSRSQLCRSRLREIRGEPTPDEALSVAREYRGRFALDFLYEDWAAGYRDSLHAAYLRVIESALGLDIASGHYVRGIEIAQLASDVEPDSEEIQVALLRLYRLSGANAAAAEQYGHYAQTLRDIGIEPQPFSSL
ncbi:MAG: OmpR/PhoB-type protein [Chloroflexi bacterium]|nr:OmpR/PhoB-type protein [Chloroflexota bacterium]